MVKRSSLASKLEDAYQAMYRFDERLVCWVERLEYDFGTKTGRLFFPECNCCDMQGAIEMLMAVIAKSAESKHLLARSRTLVTAAAAGGAS